MDLLRKAASFFKNRNKGKSEGEATTNILKQFLKSQIGIPLLFIIPVVLLFLVALFSVTLSELGYDLEIMHLVDSSSERVGINLNYDFEEYYRLSDEATESSGNPSADFRGTDIGTVSSFNQHIIDSVNAAGFGTRQGVVAAGMALVGDYIKYTGYRVKYDQETRQASSTEGIYDENYLALDCSGFSFWALYNGGFSVPSDLRSVYTADIYKWSNNRGYTSETTGGQSGDFLVTRGEGHIVLIVGTYDSGYWCLEEVYWGTGAKLTKRDYDDLSGYVRIDMTDYYNDSGNVRER